MVEPFDSLINDVIGQLMVLRDCTEWTRPATQGMDGGLNKISSKSKPKEERVHTY